MMYDVLSPAGISNATGLSRDGKYLVGSRYESAGPASGVILHVDAAGTPSTVFSQANIVLNEVNSSGVAVGARGEDPQRWIAVFVDSNQKVNDLPLTRESGWAANSINEAGLVCGGGQSQESGAESRSFVCDANRNKIIRWIDPLPRNQWSFARAINEDGNVAGTCGDPLPALSVVFREETDGVKDLGLGRFGGLNSSGIVCGTLFTGADYPGYFTVAWHLACHARFTGGASAAPGIF